MVDNFKEPSNFSWGKFKDENGAKIRYGSAVPKNSEIKGTMVIVTGFRETTEKYFEVINEMTEKGFAVWIMDWRGQGGSERFFKNDPKKMHYKHNGYKENVRTLHKFVNKVIKNKKSPLVLMAHSMGANISIRYLSDYPDVFDAGIMTAPMFDINTGDFIKPVARAMVSFAKSANLLEKYIPKGKGLGKSEAKFKGNRLTSDINRFNAFNNIYKRNEQLIMNGPTYSWVYESFKSIDIINDESYLKSIKTPLLIQTSGKDFVVDKKAQTRAIRILPNSLECHISDAKHEILMERDELRNIWLEKVDFFLSHNIGAHHNVLLKNKKNNTPHNPY